MTLTFWQNITFFFFAHFVHFELLKILVYATKFVGECDFKDLFKVKKTDT